jgi:hypothetical protein
VAESGRRRISADKKILEYRGGQGTDTMRQCWREVEERENMTDTVTVLEGGRGKRRYDKPSDKNSMRKDSTVT